MWQASSLHPTLHPRESVSTWPRCALRQELPEALGSLRRLKVLALDQNSIAAVPPAIFLGCDVLQTLSLHENPITIEACGSRSQSPKIGRPSVLAATTVWAPGRLLRLNRRSALEPLLSARVLPKPNPLQLPCQPVSCCRCARRAQELTHTQGYDRLDARRRMKHDKQIAAGVLMPKRGMDEGVDRRLAPR